MTKKSSGRLLGDDIYKAAEYARKALNKYLRLPVGRRVQTSRGPGVIKKWEPLGPALTDSLVLLDNGTECWFGLSRQDTKPIDNKSALPSRKAANKLAKVAKDLSLHAIARRSSGQATPPTRDIVRGRTTTPKFRLL